MKKFTNESNTIEKALEHLADYQTTFEYFEYDEQSKAKWNNLQETMRELYVIQLRMEDKAKTNL